jgi:hypothetical protein
MSKYSYVKPAVKAAKSLNDPRIPTTILNLSMPLAAAPAGRAQAFPRADPGV